eukprot:3006437-Pleurochrysis_carterae.AAC.1
MIYAAAYFNMPNKSTQIIIDKCDVGFLVVKALRNGIRASGRGENALALFPTEITCESSEL